MSANTKQMIAELRRSGLSYRQVELAVGIKGNGSTVYRRLLKERPSVALSHGLEEATFAPMLLPVDVAAVLAEGKVPASMLEEVAG